MTLTLEEIGKNRVKNLYFGELVDLPEQDNSGNYKIHIVGTNDEYVLTDDLDCQKSRYHSESISDHVAYVVAKMEQYSNIGKMIGLFHDTAKVSTVQINARGEYCFYGHEEKSADNFTRMFFDNNTFTKIGYDEAYLIDVIIRLHLQLKLLKGITRQCFIKGFCLKYGDHAYKLLEALDKADHGLTEEQLADPVIQETISKGYRLIGSMEF